jgi:ribonuclease Y
MSEEEEGSHAVVAANMLQKYGEDPQVVNAVAASHEEVQDISIYSPLLKVADAISAVRPGARADSMDGYVQRIFALEEIAKKIEGVKEVYALQAGRELRVIVEPSSISEMEAQKMARKIRSRIEEDLTYPDTIKVTLIRESRFSETAK